MLQIVVGGTDTGAAVDAAAAAAAIGGDEILMMLMILTVRWWWYEQRILSLYEKKRMFHQTITILATIHFIRFIELYTMSCLSFHFDF